MDIYDQATLQEELAREYAIKAVRDNAVILKPTGACFNCKALLIDNDTAQGCFCDSYCRDDWQKRAMRVKHGQ